jgi:hypothetical protein
MWRGLPKSALFLFLYVGFYAVIEVVLVCCNYLIISIFIAWIMIF